MSRRVEVLKKKNFTKEQQKKAYLASTAACRRAYDASGGCWSIRDCTTCSLGVEMTAHETILYRE